MGDSSARSKQVSVDTLGFLANNLRGYEASSILREQLQNADDACHQQGLTGELRITFLADRLVVENPSVLTPEDWRRIETPNSRGKFTDAEQTGEFGVGFWGSLHLTDAPIVTSGAVREVLHPEGEIVEERLPTPIDGTRFEFVYRRKATERSRKLDARPVTPAIEQAMAATFRQQVGDLLLFTRAIDRIRFQFPDGEVVTAARTSVPLAPDIERRCVNVSSREDASEYLVVTGNIANPMANRSGHVEVALPVKSHDDVGYVFFTFPTETQTGLNLSINGHFRATDDRRSLENTGEAGEWNDRIFRAAGELVGRHLETLLTEKLTRVDYEKAATWFAHTSGLRSEIDDRALHFMEKLDAAARVSRVIPDDNDELQTPGTLVLIPIELDAILRPHVSGVARRPQTDAVVSVYQRWGLDTWTPAQIANWLTAVCGESVMPRTEAPEFMHNAANVVRVLQHCNQEAHRLRSAAVLLGTDDCYHPTTSELRRPSTTLGAFAKGLALPVLHDDFAHLRLAHDLSETGIKWLHAAVMATAPSLVGRSVPSPSIGVVSSISQVVEVLTLFTERGFDLSGLPLALDPAKRLQRFGPTTVQGIPRGASRVVCEQLAARLGLHALHAQLDDPTIVGQGCQTFSANYIAELLPVVSDWDPVREGRDLVLVLGALDRERSFPDAVRRQLQELRIWPGSDGQTHVLSDLHLPARDRLRGVTSQVLVAHELLQTDDPADEAFRVLHDVLRVEILDTTEQVVQACEHPPTDPADQRDLLRQLADCPTFSNSQRDRLKHAAFIRGRDARLHQPAGVLLYPEALPLWLDGLRLDAGIAADSRLREILHSLGARWLPTPGQLGEVADMIAEMPVQGAPADDPGLRLWEFLDANIAQYSDYAGNVLARKAWLRCEPGAARRRPEECIDPKYGFARCLYPVPAGVRTPGTALRDALKIRGALSAIDLVKVGELAAASGESLPRLYFYELERQTSHERDHPTLAKLADVAFIRHADGFARPRDLVSPKRYRLWGRLRHPVPPDLQEWCPQMLKVWGVADNDGGEPDWDECLDVLKEIAERGALDRDMRRLAEDRLADVARAFESEPGRLLRINMRLFVLTSLGMRRVEESYRPDLPPGIVERLRPYLPIVDQSADTVSLFEAANLQSLRAHVAFDARAEDTLPSPRWERRLAVHRSNVLRFLAANHVDITNLRDSWPPAVTGVRRLTVTASVGASVLTEWADADAYLDLEAATHPTLYVRGDRPNARSVVDALASEFGLDPQRKSCLVAVLNTDDAGSGAAELDYSGIPQLAEFSDVPEDADVGPIELKLMVEDEQEEPDLEVSRSAGASWDLKETAEDLAGPRAPSSKGIEQQPRVQMGTEFPGRQPDARTASPTTNGLAEPRTAGGRRSTDTPLRSPRGVTDEEDLEDLGFTFVHDLDEQAPERAYEPEAAHPDEDRPPNSKRLCLSYADIARGQLPISEDLLDYLTTGTAIQGVDILGEQRSATVDSEGNHVTIADGLELFLTRRIIPGTYVDVHPGLPGFIEARLEPYEHVVRDVWLLELNEAGVLERVRVPETTLDWAADDAFYRAERRLEDFDALLADVGASALELVLKVFAVRPGEGLTAEEVWGLVAINRLFAFSTIEQILYQQDRIFIKEEERWFCVGDEVRKLRRAPRSGSSRSGTNPSGRRSGGSAVRDSRSASTEKTFAEQAMTIARRLARLLEDLSADELRLVVQALGINRWEADSEFAGACTAFLERPDQALQESLARDLADDPQRALLLMQVLEATPGASPDTARQGIALVQRYGNAAACRRANDLVRRLDSVVDDRDEVDPVERAELLLDEDTEGIGQHEAILAAAVKAMATRPSADPLEQPDEVAGLLVRKERILRRITSRQGASSELIEARRDWLDWLMAQMPSVDGYAEQGQQRLLSLLLLARAADVVDVLDALNELVKRAGLGERPHDVWILQRLVAALGQKAQIGKGNRVVAGAQTASTTTFPGAPTPTTAEFVQRFTELARLSEATVYGQRR